MKDKLIAELREFVGHAVINGYCSPAGAHKILGIIQDNEAEQGEGMTREELVEIMKTNTYRDAADKIYAAIEKEREGDIVIHHGTINRHGEMTDEYDFRTFVDVRLCGRTGQLIFRPTKADKGER